MTNTRSRIPHTARSSSNSYQWLHSSSEDSEGAQSSRHLSSRKSTRRSLFSCRSPTPTVNTFKKVTAGGRSIMNINPFSPFVLRSLSSPRPEGSNPPSSHTFDLAFSSPSDTKLSGPINAETSGFDSLRSSSYVRNRNQEALIQNEESRFGKDLGSGSALKCQLSILENNVRFDHMRKDIEIDQSQIPKLLELQPSSVADIIWNAFATDTAQKNRHRNFMSNMEGPDAPCMSCDDSVYQIRFTTPHSIKPIPINVHRDVNGNTWLVRAALDGQAYFLKEVPCVSINRAQQILFWEIQALQLADRCENLTSLHKHWWDAKSRICIILTECCAGGLVPRFLRQCTSSEKSVREVVLGALNALQTLHSNGLIHGNCHIDNFFVSPVLLDSEKAIYSTIKLGNFGSIKPNFLCMKSYIKQLPPEIKFSNMEEPIHTAFPCDDVLQLGTSLLEFLGVNTVIKFHDPLRRIIFHMAGYVLTNEYDYTKETVKQRLMHIRYCPYTASDLLDELEQYESSRSADILRAQLLDEFRYPGDTH